MRTDFTALKEQLAVLAHRAGRDPRLLVRIVLGSLLAANLVAAYFVFRPLGGSPEELEQQARDLQSQIAATRNSAVRLTQIVNKTESGRKQGEDFLVRYFMERREASSTVIDELARMAKESNIRPRDHTFSYEPIEGSDNLSLMIINGNCEGTYADLVRYLNRLDRSPRFIIVDQMQAAPQQSTGTLTVQMKMYTFVREGGPPTVDAPREERVASPPPAPLPAVPKSPPPINPIATARPANPAKPSPVGPSGATGPVTMQPITPQSQPQPQPRPGGPSGPFMAPNRPFMPPGMPGAATGPTDQPAPNGEGPVRRPRFGRRTTGE